MLNLRLAHFPGLLGVDEDAPVRAMYRSSMDPRAKLLEPFLSVLRAEGHEIGDVGRSYLAMNARRLSAYQDIGARITREVPTAVPLKGPGIVAHYPEWLSRGCVDLDVYVPDVADAWRAAQSLAAYEPVSEISVSVRRHSDGYDLFLGLSWDSPAAAFDARYRVEVTTLPLLGDGRTVPSRRGVPPDPLSVQLVLVAEEQFQRPIIGRDVLDYAVLLLAGRDSDPVDQAERLADWRLASEGAALLAAVDRHGLLDDGRPRALLRALQPWMEKEAAQRRQPVTEPVVEYGLPVSADVTADPPRFDEYPFGTIALCPFGAYLLVTSPEVEEDTYDLARGAVGAGRT